MATARERKDSLPQNSLDWWNAVSELHQADGAFRDNPAEFALIGKLVVSPVLDVGCSAGELCKYILPPREYIGVDVSSEWIKAARKRHPWKVFVNADFLTLPRGMDRAFNTVCALQIVEHFPDPAVAMKRLALLPRQLLIVSVPRGLPSEAEGKASGHYSGWRTDKEFAAFMGKYGTVTMHVGNPNHWLACVKVKA